MDGPTTSLDADEIVEHPLAAIAATLLCFPQVELTHGAEPSWLQWRARWRDGENELDFSLSHLGPGSHENLWGGSELKGHCTIGQVLALWVHLLSRHQGVWLHNSECEMETPQSFLQIYALADPSL